MHRRRGRPRLGARCREPDEPMTDDMEAVRPRAAASLRVRYTMSEFFSSVESLTFFGLGFEQRSLRSAGQEKIPRPFRPRWPRVRLPVADEDSVAEDEFEISDGNRSRWIGTKM